MQKAVFLDRDGVLNRELGDYVRCLNDFELLPNVFEALRVIQSRGYLLVIVSNQSGISQGFYSESTLEVIHQYLLKSLIDEGIFVSELYYCRHHPSVEQCLCRKPKSLLVEKALARFDIDAAVSFFVGDRQRDIDCAERVGVKGILIDSNSDLRSVLPLLA